MSFLVINARMSRNDKQAKSVHENVSAASTSAEFLQAVVIF